MIITHNVLRTYNLKQAESFVSALAEWGIPGDMSHSHTNLGHRYDVCVAKQDYKAACAVRERGGYGIIRVGA